MKKILFTILTLSLFLPYTLCCSASAVSTSDLSDMDTHVLLIGSFFKKAQEESTSEVESSEYSGETIIDNDICSFKIIGLDEDSIWGKGFKVFCENKSNKPLTFSWDNVSVNGSMCDPFWAKEIAPGKKANASISFMSDDIKSFDEVVFTLRVSNSEDWMEEPYVEEEFTIYPTGLSKDTIKYDTVDISDSLVLEDSKDLLFAITDIEPDGDWGYTIKVYIENKTDKTVMVSWDDVSVNGYMCDPFWAKEIAPNKNATANISFFESTLEENGIEDITEIEFTLRVTDSDDWLADPIYSESFTFNP